MKILIMYSFISKTDSNKWPGINCTYMHKIPHNSWVLEFFMRFYIFHYCEFFCVIAGSVVRDKLLLLKKGAMQVCYGSERNVSFTFYMYDQETLRSII